MSRTILLPLILCLSIALHAQNTLEHRVHFDVASDQLTTEEIGKLASLCALVQDKQWLSLEIIGQADVRGETGYNRDLSDRRAKAVRNYLQEHCDMDVPVKLIPVGESRSTAGIGDEPGMHAERRVDIRFTSAERSFSINDHVHPFVEPLMPNADVPREHFVVDAGNAIEFFGSDGVRVRIAPDAIVHEDGSPVVGEVDITYRSFNDTWSIIASGIPMHVGTGDDAGHMESRGMFEVYASQAGERLRLKEGERISLTLPQAVDRSAEYKDWMLDGSTGEWVEREDGTVDRTVGSDQGTMNAVSQACMRYDKLIAEMPAMPDTTVLLERMESVDYCGSVPCSPAVRPYVKRKNVLMSPYSTKAIPAVRVEMVKGAYRGNRLIGFKLHVDHPSMREWRSFPRDMVWAYNGPMDHTTFRKVISRKHFYQDVVFKLNDCGTKGNIMLKDRGEWITLPVDVSVHQGDERELAKWNSHLATYETAFEKKRVRFDDRVASKWRSIEVQRQRTMTTAWQQVRRFMTDEELAMNLEEWHEYAVNAISAMNMARFASAQGSPVTRSFAMSGFGIYNCDRILPREAIQPVFVQLQDEQEQLFKWTQAYAIIEGQKAVITYWGSGTGVERDLRLSKKIGSMIFVDGSGEMMVVTRPTDQIVNARAVVKGRRMPQPSDPQQLQDFLALK